MPDQRPFLVYRDRIGAPSEIGFLRRQYIGFTRLTPVWTGRILLPGAEQIGAHRLRLGGEGPLGPLRRLLFRQFGVVPTVAVPEREKPRLVGAGLAGLHLAPVLHAQFARGGALALPLARALGLRLIVTLHGGDVSKQKNWHRTVLSRRWPEVVRTANTFVCVSDAVAEAARSRGVPDGKLLTLPIGVEIPTVPPPRRPSFHLFVGRFVEKKGIAELAGAIRRLRGWGDSTPLVCVGDGPMRPVLETLAREVPGVSLTGWLSPQAVQARMARAISLIVPSIVAANGDAEGLPSVIPEAMAQGCPVIASDAGGLAEALRHGQTGWLVAPGDAEALARAMQELAGDTDLAERLGAAGFRFAEQALNARRQSERLEALLLSA